MAEAAPARIELTRVGEGCWRLCDPALHESDPRRLVAFVECAEDPSYGCATRMPTRVSTLSKTRWPSPIPCSRRARDGSTLR